MRLLAVLYCGMACMAGALALADWAFPPDLSRYLDRSSVVEDRSGAPLRIFMSRDQKWRLHTRPADVDPLYLAMLKTYEDKRFDRHIGFDPLAALRAAGQAAAAGRFVSGASTLTMQAARLLEPRRRSLAAKAIEIVRAAQLEARLGKDGVLAAYLTLAPFGGPVEGVRAASLKLFGHEPNMLTPAEAALLIALPQAPNARRPDIRPEGARAGRAAVLRRAVEAGVLEADAAAAADAAPLPRAYGELPFKAPHVAQELLAEARSADAVRATIDGELQAKLERRLRAALADVPAPTTVAAIIVDAETAEVRALAGGPAYFDRRRAGMIDMTRAVRSPGSALKPFIYGMAFDRLIARPDTLIEDRPFRAGGYAPTNFDRGYMGDVTIKEALARSLNIPAVKVLRRLGADRLDGALKTAGVDLAFDREGGGAGLAIALGGVGIDLRTLARAYIAFAGDGRIPEKLALVAGDKVAWRPFLAPSAAADVRRSLASAPPPAGRHLSKSGLPYKTGTSYGYRDALAVGIAGGHVIAVWVGRPDGGPCAGCIGRVVAAPILFDLANLLNAPMSVAAPAIGKPPPAHLRHFDRPSGAQRAAPGPALELAFPVDGADLQLGPGGRAPLVATGGEGPYLWLVDGAPVGRSRPGGALAWHPAGAGFHHLRVVAADGRSASARVFVTMAGG